jgi:hypothetical protein
MLIKVGIPTPDIRSEIENCAEISCAKQAKKTSLIAQVISEQFLT